MVPSRGSGPSLAKSRAGGPGADVPLPGCLCTAALPHTGAKPAAAPCRALRCAGERPQRLEDTPGLLGPRPHVAPPADVASEMALSTDPRPSVLSSPVQGCPRGRNGSGVTACPCPAPCRGCGWSRMEHGQDEANVFAGCSGAPHVLPAPVPATAVGGWGAAWRAQHSLSTPPPGAWLCLGLGRNPPKGRRRKRLRFSSAKIFAQEKGSAVV